MRKKSEKPRVATLNDVAKAANVSTATVSRCLNSPEQVGEETQNRVMKAVDDLSYSPNFGAQIMAARRTNTIGAVIPTMENSIFARGIQAFEEELNTYDYTLIVASTSYRADIEEQQIRNLIARGAEGLLLIGYQRDDKIYKFLENRRVPIVLTWAFQENSSHQSVGFKNRQAMEELTKLVLSYGHKNIATISSDTITNDRARARLEGIKAVITQNTSKDIILNTIEAPYSIDSGADAFSTLMSAPNPPSVVMCGNDVLAVGAVMKAKEMGMRIPDDISITGFDDIELAQVVEPPLTTVHVPHSKMGQRAAQVLVEAITSGKPGTGEFLDTFICERNTLAAPKQ